MIMANIYFSLLSPPFFTIAFIIPDLAVFRYVYKIL